MAAAVPRCDQTVAWQALAGHHHAHGRVLDLRALFGADPDRVNRLGLSAPHVFGDLSRGHWDFTTQRHLMDLARECRIEARRDALLRGEVMNRSEGRAALHTALRAPRGQAPHSEEVHDVLDRMLAFVDQVHAAGQITDVVNIGIGGSDLGPLMGAQALEGYIRPGMRAHFVSNVDGQDLHRTLQRLDARRTLFVVASKTFTTQETMANAHSARRWFFEAGGQDVAAHFVGTTTNLQAASDFGIQTTFGFWDWVGGRFSLWSAIGLPLALAIGSANFRALLAGAHAMDQHFAQAPIAQNLPLQLGLLDVWHRNFMGYATRCVSPYDHGLRRLPAYLQQLVMESNGKSVDAFGQPLNLATSEVVWGEPGTNGQHAFFQMLHQGSEAVPVEFVLVKQPCQPMVDAATPAMRAHWLHQHQALLANGLAQAQALMWGKRTDQALGEAAPTAAPDLPAEELARDRTFSGNRPSITLVLDRLEPASLGALIAMHEHRTFVSGALWGINSFDQWGVELGKALCKDLLPRLASGDVAGLDAATASLIQRLRA
jgi:glucose-6-phosphate isomerase